LGKNARSTCAALKVTYPMISAVAASQMTLVREMPAAWLAQA
jgi:hypothetical protein